MLNPLIIAISGSLGSAETVGTIQAAVLYALTLIVVMLLCVRELPRAAVGPAHARNRAWARGTRARPMSACP